MQLMPSTATEMADAPTSTLMLKDPANNFELGARYLNHLLEQWENDPFRSIASYNAGPGAVASWVQPTDQDDDALWVERIPYCLLYTSPSPRDRQKSRMPSSA